MTPCLTAEGREGPTALRFDQAYEKWLKEKCLAWAKQFDGQLRQLEEGRDPLQVRDQIDETVNRLEKALRDRAAEIEKRQTA